MDERIRIAVDSGRAIKTIDSSTQPNVGECELVLWNDSGTVKLITKISGTVKTVTFS